MEVPEGPSPARSSRRVWETLRWRWAFRLSVEHTSSKVLYCLCVELGDSNAMKTWTERTVYWVDLPDPNATDENSSYVNIATFERRRDAREFLCKRYGMPARIASFFITKGTV